MANHLLPARTPEELWYTSKQVHVDSFCFPSGFKGETKCPCWSGLSSSPCARFSSRKLPVYPYEPQIHFSEKPQDGHIILLCRLT